jgi:hypothetical protein
MYSTAALLFIEGMSKSASLVRLKGVWEGAYACTDPPCLRHGLTGLSGDAPYMKVTGDLRWKAK